MDSLTLRQLRYFEALTKYGHFGRAAEACAVSQPALSVQIKDLEERLGAALFERGPKSVRLTAFGEDVAVRVRPILQSVEELGDLARVAGSGLSGQFRLGVIPTIAPYLLPKLIPALSENYASLDLTVRETMTPRLIEELRDGRLDALILALPIGESGLHEEPLFDEPLLLVRPRAHADWPVPTAQQLQDMRVLLLEEGHCFRDAALSFCGMVPQDGLGGSSLTTLVQMVGAGLGVTFIPAMAASVEGPSAKVDIRPLAGLEATRQIGMVWRNTSPAKHHFRDVAALVREIGLTLR